MSEDQLRDFSFPGEQENIISFHAEDIDFVPEQPKLLAEWIRQVIAQQQCTLSFLNYIFCTDDYLHSINVAYLDHDTLTDIITFPYADPPRIEGDIFISIDRIRENAATLRLPFLQELHRVMIHGVLHLCGQGDKTEQEKGQMRAKEDEALDLLGE